MTADELLALVHARSGHFVHESGYHSNVWWDLEALCQRPAALSSFVTALATRVAAHHPKVVCGALVEGAFVGLLVASEVGCEFAYTLRCAGDARQLFPVRYHLPATLRQVVRDKRVVIVNDVISAGSAVRGTIEDVRQHGGNVVAVASLVLLGHTFADFCQAQQIPLITLFQQELSMWLPEACPLCAAGDTPEYPAND